MVSQNFGSQRRPVGQLEDIYMITNCQINATIGSGQGNVQSAEIMVAVIIATNSPRYVYMRANDGVPTSRQPRAIVVKIVFKTSTDD